MKARQDLFGGHDPGGKRRMPLLPGVTGLALFRGEAREHRILALRWWDTGSTEWRETDGAYVLWVGMNPSMATGEEDDLTVRKEQNWTKTLGCNRYVKVNLSSYRSTDPAGLRDAEELAHPDNIPTILKWATDVSCHRVVLATGVPPEVLAPLADQVLRMLREAKVAMWCLGRTKAGWPRHTSRIGYATPFERFA